MTTLRSATRRRVKLGLQSLEARDVPAATPILDLSTAGAQAPANSAILKQTTAVPSADFHTFLALQNAGTEEGYNTDAPPPFQLNQTGGTRSLLLADVPIVNIGGTDYRQFIVDVMETTKNPQVTLEELRVYLAEAGNLTGYNSRTKTLSGIGAAWDLDGAGNVSVKLNSQLNTGTTTKGDAFVYIPSAFFGSSTYVYLYAKFGGKFKSDNGAESIGVLPIAAPPPAGSISGTVYADVNGDGLYEPGPSPLDSPVPHVTMMLEQTFDGGINWVQVGNTVQTDANGVYSFTGLSAGTYRVTKVDNPLPTELFDGVNNIGTVNGNITGVDDNPGIGDTGLPDRMSGIVLGNGDSGINYNFAMLPLNGG